MRFRTAMSWALIVLATLVSLAMPRPGFAVPADAGLPGSTVVPGRLPDSRYLNPYDGWTLSVSVVGQGMVARSPERVAYTDGTPVELRAQPGAGFDFGGWSGDLQGSTNPQVLGMTTHRAVTATFVDVANPTVRVEFPNQDGPLVLGDVVSLRWSAADNDTVVSADLLLSRTGPTGAFETIALGVPATGKYLWRVQGPITGSAVLKVVARDRAGHVAADLSDATFRIENVHDYPIIRLRADSALASAPPAIPGAAGPWQDLAGDHDATLREFRGNLASGWKGDGSVASPYRLEFGNEDVGYDNRVTIPAGTISELQALNPVTAEVWFKTGYNGASSRYEYILEWVEPPAPVFDPEWEGRGMSIAVIDGKLQVYHNPWIEVTPVQPNTWYHVAVTKDTSEIRIYVNGQRLYTGNKPHMGVQESELVLGCATFRVFEGFTGSAVYSDYWTGSIGQMTLWRGALGDAAVRQSFRADSARYLPNPPVTPLAPAVRLAAAQANGSAPYAALTASSPWVDLRSGHHDALLGGFTPDSTSGWQGNGTAGSPYRLEFDGIDDRAAIPAGSVPELRTANAVSAEVWLRTGPDVASDRYQQVLEWIEGFTSSPGMSLAIQNGQLQSYFATPYWVPVAPVQPNTLYHVAIAKQPGEVRVYLNGARVFTGVTPNFGVPTSEIVLGASSWRGPGIYGEFFHGALLEVELWRGALGDADVQAHYAGGVARASNPVPTEDVHPVATPLRLALEGVRPNPAARVANLGFTLPTAAPARVDLIDVAGRRVRSFEVGSLGAGRHVLDLAGGALLPVGSYVVRLTQEGRSVTTKATVLR